MGPMEKILVAREESASVALQDLGKTREYMIDFTQNMMILVDEYADVTHRNLKQLNQLLEVGGNSANLELLKECSDMMARARYTIRDFQYIHDVVEGNFDEPIFKRTNIRSCLDEVRRVTENDSIKLSIELSTQVEARVPTLVAVEENIFN